MREETLRIEREVETETQRTSLPSLPVEDQVELKRARRAGMVYVWKNEEQPLDRKLAEKQGGLISWAGKNPVGVLKVGVRGVRRESSAQGSA
jgi:hypothetical protein